MKKGYLAVLVIGGLVGLLMYHTFGKAIEHAWGNIPYLKNVQANFIVQNYESEY